MPHKYDYVLIDKKNTARFAEYLDGSAALDNSKSYGLGILSDGETKGAVILDKDDSALDIRSIRLSQSLDSAYVLCEITKVLRKLGKGKGYKTIECRYTDDEPGITEQMLRDSGFMRFDEEAVVYRIDAYTLGSVLRDGPYAEQMRSSGVSLMTMDRVRCLNAVSEEKRLSFKELFPVDELSFAIYDENDIPKDYMIVSTLPDGSLYLADMEYQKGHKDDFLGLIYMCLGKVFMHIEPAGEFYIAAVTDRYKRLAKILFEPVFPLISVQRIFVARLDL